MYNLGVNKMTELEKIEYAKSFLDKLANGINPIDNTPVADDDIVNNVRISRCFFYVSDLLRQVVENGGINPPKKHTKVPFAITQQQLSNVEYSDEPIPISEIVRRVNSLIDTEVMRSLSYNDIAKWLIQIEALCEYNTENGKKKKKPTEMGEQLGISTEYRTGLNGMYTVIVYNKNAQTFIIDNMEAIISLKNS